MLLTEIFNKIVKWDISCNSDDLFQAMFMIDIHEYVFNANYENDKWDVSFYLYTDGDVEYDLTGTGNEFEVFATIIDILKHFIKTKNPQHIIASAKPEKRLKLYVNRLFPQAFPKEQWKYEIKQNRYIEISRK